MTKAKTFSQAACTESADAQSGGVKSVEVAGRLLRAFVGHGSPMHLNELAKRAGMAPSKAHRYLASLVQIGLAEQGTDDRRYRLGQLAIEIGAVASRSSDPISDAIERQRRLYTLVDETLTLAIWSAAGPLVIHVEESSKPIVMTMKRGTLLPLLSTATGIVFCTFLPQKQTSDLIEAELTGMETNPIVKSRGELDALTDKIRIQGYAVNAGHLLPDIMAVAAPICDEMGNVTAVLAIFGPEGRIDPARDKRAVNALLKCVASDVGT